MDKATFERLAVNRQSMQTRQVKRRQGKSRMSNTLQLWKRFSDSNPPFLGYSYREPKHRAKRASENHAGDDEILCLAESVDA